MIQEINNNYSNDSKISLLIRHGDRDNIPNGSFGNEILLNEKGKLNSIKFGESIAHLSVNKILTSPISRCVQTAEHIAKGYGSKIEIIQTTALGAPGLHIVDEDIAGKYFLEHGFIKILDNFIKGIPSPGLRNKIDYNKVMSDFINEQTDNKGLTIYVTHDSLIALYHYCYNKTVYTTNNWVQYLGGLIINKKSNEE
jgi:broad specificity phosphatase PhoE